MTSRPRWAVCTSCVVFASESNSCVQKIFFWIVRFDFLRVHSTSKNLECSAKTFATVEEPYTGFLAGNSPKNLEWT